MGVVSGVRWRASLGALLLFWLCFNPRPPAPSCSMNAPATAAAAARLRHRQVEPLVDFAVRVVPKIFPRLKTLPKHWRVILRELERSRFGSLRLKINIAPRHGKTVCLLLAIAWMMAYWPTLRHAYATYGQNFSETQGRTLKRMLVAAGVALTVSNADYFETPEGGGCYITSRDSPLLGKGIDGILGIDDPYKNRQEADSAVVQETVWDWWQDVANSRLEGPASVVLMHQRWNFEDMSGRLDEVNAGWRTLILRAINEAGEALWPEIKSLVELRKIEASNPYGFASMYQQDPVPRGNTMFHEPSRFDSAEWLAACDPSQWRWAFPLDPAVTAKESAAHSAGFVVAAQGDDDAMQMYLLDELHLQVEAPELAALVVAKRNEWLARRFEVDWARHPIGIEVLPIVCEGTGVGAPVVSTIRQLLTRSDSIVGVHAFADKRTRATPLAGAWNSKRVHVPMVKNGDHWADLVREFRRFTGLPGTKADRTDAAAHGWRFLMGGGAEQPDETDNDMPMELG